MIYGYARVSTREQNEGRQMLALNRKEVPKENIYIKSIDRLGRN